MARMEAINKDYIAHCRAARALAAGIVMPIKSLAQMSLTLPALFLSLSACLNLIDQAPDYIPIVRV